jgi:2-aminoadipate transaminase
MSWTLARRSARLNPSTIRELLKLTEQPGIVSLAGGLPSPDSFPVLALQEASARVLRDQPLQALQYAASEGFGPLREWVVADLATQGLHVQASQVLITTGSQQGLDLVAKVLVDPGSTVAVESPTYLGALQAFAPYEPRFLGVANDAQGPVVDDLPRAAAKAHDTRFLYLVPNFQNPSGRCISAQRRLDLAQAALRCGLPVVEDNPYGELWLDAPPPPPLATQLGDAAFYLGSFSKVLAPGLRLGYVVAPEHLYAKLLQAKQAADLHTSGLNQRVVFEVIKDGFLTRHTPTVRARYKTQRDAMQAALLRHLQPLCSAQGERVQWAPPLGGMFFWLTLPTGLDATALLPLALQAGVAFVPGSPFFANGGHTNTLRLSFVTATPAQIDSGVAALAAVLAQALERSPGLS